MPSDLLESSEAARCFSTRRPLTHSSDSSREGLAVKPTQDPSVFIFHAVESGCWLWDGYMDRNGYGKIHDRANKRSEWAHRFSYLMHKGDIPDKHEIDHVCQVTRCVNPFHLEAVTKREHVRRTMTRLGKDDLHLAAAQLRLLKMTYGEIAEALNYADRGSASSAVLAAVKKNLISADEVPPKKTLSCEDRDDIRAMYEFGIPQTAIGKFYEVDATQVSRICGGMSSGHERRKRPLA